MRNEQHGLILADSPCESCLHAFRIDEGSSCDNPEHSWDSDAFDVDANACANHTPIPFAAGQVWEWQGDDERGPQVCIGIPSTWENSPIPKWRVWFPHWGAPLQTCEEPDLRARVGACLLREATE